MQRSLIIVSFLSYEMLTLIYFVGVKNESNNVKILINEKLN